MAETTFSVAAFGTAPESVRTISREKSSTKRRRERGEYWLYFALCFPLFLIVAVFGRLLPRSMRPFASEGRSVFGEAKAAANTVLPYVFMA
ncbi:MAG: hypothetical protein AAFV62_10850 [Pseudomonadota bacterium]